MRSADRASLDLTIMVLPRQSFRVVRPDWYLLVPAIGPALLLLLGSADFMFDPPGWVDTFGMLGRFWHYAEHNPLFEAYKGSRLPWILPGFVVHQLFDTVTASYVLHTTVLLGSSVGLYLLLRDTLQDRCTAAVVSAAWSCYTWIHVDGGWDYHILAASAYYLWFLWMLARSAASAPSRARLWAMGGGAALACAVHTHIVFVAFVPIAALLYANVPGPSVRAGVHRIVSAAEYAMLGGIGVTAVLGAVNAAAGGQFLFFVPQIQYALELSESGNRWVRNPAVWLPESGHLVIPSLTLVAGLVWIASRRARMREVSPTSRFASLFVYQGVLAFLLTAYLQFAARQTILDPSYGAFPLYCHVFPMLGALLARLEGRERWAPVLAGGATLAIVAPLLLLLPWRLPRYAATLVQAFHLPGPLALLVPLMVGATGLMLMCFLRGWGRIATFAVFYGLLNAWLTFMPNAYGLGTPGVYRDALIVLRSLDRYTASLDPSLFAIRYWGEPEIVEGPNGPFNLSDVFLSFTATRRRSLLTAAYDRPGIRSEELTRDDLYSVHCLGVLSSKTVHARLVDRITNRFAELGVPLVEVGRHEVASGVLSIALTVLTLPADLTEPRHESVPCPPAG